MLFDLRGTGRRRTIKIVYVTLAFLMGGGLVLFGIGGSGALSGGLVDAITQSEGGGDGDERFRDQEQRATAAARANPRDPERWAAAARARFNLASVSVDPGTGQFSEEGKAQLEAAIAQEVIALDRDSVGAYTQLAVLSYQAGQLRKGDLARDKALELSEPDMRETLRGQLEGARAQAAAAAGEATPTPTPEAE